MSYKDQCSARPSPAAPTTHPQGILGSSDGLLNRLLSVEARLLNIVECIYGPIPPLNSEDVGNSEVSCLVADLRVSHRTVGRIEELISQLQDGL